MKNNVITRLLQSEVDHVQKDDPSLTAIAPANYKFSYKGVSRIGDRLFTLPGEAAEEANGTFQGPHLPGRAQWIAGASGRQRGEVPSFFVKHIEFVQEYADVQSFTLPVHVHSEAKARIVGRTIVDITHRNYQPAPSTSRQMAHRFPSCNQFWPGIRVARCSPLQSKVMHPALKSVAHRPWPIPTGPWVMAQSWHDLLFAHWPIVAGVMRSLVPRQLALDIFDGQCWVGVVPFWMSGVRARGTPAIGRMVALPGTQRSHLCGSGRQAGRVLLQPGCGESPGRENGQSPLSSPVLPRQHEGGRPWRGDRLFLTCGSVDRRSFADVTAPGRRSGCANQGAWSTGSPNDIVFTRCTEKQLYRGEIHHAPWPLQEASAEIDVNTMASSAGIVLPDTKPLLHFAKRLDVLIWPLKRAS